MPKKSKLVYKGGKRMYEVTGDPLSDAARYVKSKSLFGGSDPVVVKGGRYDNKDVTDGMRKKAKEKSKGKK